MINLTTQEVYELILKGAASCGWQGFASKVQEAFKEKNSL